MYGVDIIGRKLANFKYPSLTSPNGLSGFSSPFIHKIKKIIVILQKKLDKYIYYCYNTIN